jgi:hypothetical protein
MGQAKGTYAQGRKDVVGKVKGALVITWKGAE